MGRRKKEEIINENPMPMAEDAMNPPIETEKSVEKSSEKTTVAPKASTFKRVDSSSARVNCRKEPNGDIMFAIDRNKIVKVVDEIEVDGKLWSRIEGYMMSEFLKDI